jgi:hypothetical protein
MPRLSLRSWTIGAALLGAAPVSSLAQTDAAPPAPASAPAPAPASTPAPPPAPAAAQGNTVVQLRQKGSGIPIGKVEVEIGGTKLLTAPDGSIRVNVPAAGDGKIVFTRQGFETLEVPFDKLRPPGEFDIFLYPRLGPDENVVTVTGRKRPQVSRKSVSIEESRAIAPGGDPVQVVKLLPGVQTSDFGSEVVVRGSGPRDSKYYVDDLEVPFIFHAIGDLSVVPAPLMQEVEFDSGGFGPEYGEATGGVIVIRTKTEIPERPKTEFVVNIPFYSGIYHERPLSESSSISVSARRSYVDAFIKAALKNAEDEAGGSITLVPYFGDGHIVYLRKDDSGHTRISAIGAYDGLKAALPSDSFSDEEGRVSLAFKTDFINIGVERMQRLGKDWRMTTTPQFYNATTDANFFGNTFAVDLRNFRAPTEFVNRLSKTEELVFGVDPVVGQADVHVNAIEFHPEDPTYDPEDAPKKKVVKSYPYQSYAAWAGIDQQLGPVLLSPGVRGFYNSQIDKTSADPRLRSRIALGEANTVKAAVGQYSESPDPSVANKEFGNAGLDFTRSMHYVLGIESKWGDEWTTEFTVYYKRAHGVVTPDEDKRYDNDGSFKSRGAEVFVRRNLTSRLFGWFSYTYSQTDARDTDQDPYHDAQYDQTHVINAVASYKLTTTWQLGTRYKHHTGDTYTPVEDAVYNVNLDKYQAREADDADGSKRLPDFNALTLYAKKDWLMDTWKLGLKFGMESYWPKKQVLGVGYNYDYSEKQMQHGLTAIPFLELQGEI